MKKPAISSYCQLVVLILLVSYRPLAATDLTTVRVASGLEHPTFATFAPGDPDRLFILEQPGRIRILKNGSLLPAAFLDIDALISSGGERGLLGLAFHPDYAGNGYFYVDYTDNSGNTVVARYTVSADPDSADPGSGSSVITINQPFANHNGGMLAFGPADGYLYIGLGDGGSLGDPNNNAQNDSTLLGKILRIDVDGDPPYGIPVDNPYVGPGYPLDEIWAKGLRNPWRFSFDRLTTDLYIADVGESSWEEVDFQPSTSAGGNNYGWRLKEGTHCFNPPTNCDPGGLTDPIYEYSHDGGRCSISGGYVYRGGVMPNLQGTYFFGDYCSAQIWSFEYDGSNMTNFMERTTELAPGDGLDIQQISSFGEDVYGEMYICDFVDGEIFKIIPSNPGAIAGAVTDQAAQPLQGVLVSIPGTALHDSTDANGEYVIHGLGDGLFDVSFVSSSALDTLIMGVAVSSGDTTILDISLQPVSGYDYLPGDANMHVGIWPPAVIGGDVTYLVGYFRGFETSQPCFLNAFWCSADVNGDCQVIGGDVTRLVNYFRGISSLQYCHDYGPNWPTPAQLPSEAPSGWPNCEN